MEINILVDEDFEKHLEVGWLQNVVERVLVIRNADPRVELGLVVTNQGKMQELNWSYLGRDRPTDVLAFSMLPEPLAVTEAEPKYSFTQPPDSVFHLGEVIISYPQAVIQSEEHGHSVKREIAILVIHGVLHLMGYDHNEPELERQMEAEAEKILNGIEGELD